MKELIKHDLKLYVLETFLDTDNSTLAPKGEDYDFKIATEERLFRDDQEKLVENATRAWSLVRNLFKSRSHAESIIKPKEYEGALNEI
jgi:hypothetical protein